jgi:hypothetical protein
VTYPYKEGALPTTKNLENLAENYIKTTQNYGVTIKAMVTQLNNLKKPENPQIQQLKRFSMKKMQILKTKISWSMAFFPWMKNTHLRVNQMALIVMMK